VNKIHDHHNHRLIIDRDGKELQLDTERVLKAALTDMNYFNKKLSFKETPFEEC